MEQKKVQRIVGILVIIAIVIVVMPLLFGKNNFPVQQAANIKAPPFPDQPQATETTSSDSSLPALASAANMDNAEANPLPPQTTSAHIMPTTDQTTNEKALPAPPMLSGDVKATPIANIQPSDAAKTDSGNADASTQSQTVVVTPEMAKKINEDTSAATLAPGLENKSAGTVIYEPVTNAPTDIQKPAEKPVEQPVKNPVEQASAQPAENAQPVQPVVAAPVKPVVAKVKNRSSKNVKLAHARLKSKTHAHPIVQAKLSSGWAVQMGNFSVKQNALRLANSLQAAGYKAFTKEIILQDGRARTRVYIGPEHKQTAAVALSKNIHQKLSMQGFVVPLNKA